MTPETVAQWYARNPFATVAVAVVFLAVVLFIARDIIGRAIITLSARTQTQVDDLLVQHLQPLRGAWIAPLLAVYLLSTLVPAYKPLLRKAALFGILWLAAITLGGLLTAVNEIYESRPTYNGIAIQGYLDIVRILVYAVALILSVSLLSGKSPLGLLTGLGALTAVLMLVFQGTILSLVASIQISSMGLIKEGDYIEVPAYNASGDVVNISLHSIKVQNNDKTITVIPTHKIMDSAYKNWRGMTEAGGRRIQRQIRIDMTSMRIFDSAMLEQLGRIDLIHDYLQQKIREIKEYQQAHQDHYDSPLDGPQLTNTELFRVYTEAYLRNRRDIHQQGMPLLVRSLEPAPDGLPIEVYVFTRTTEWGPYERIQSEIFDHLLAVAPHFRLRVFQEPTGADFSRMGQAA